MTKIDKEKPEKYDKRSLKGAFASVLFVGAFIAVLYLILLAIYMSRI